MHAEWSFNYVCSNTDTCCTLAAHADASEANFHANITAKEDIFKVDLASEADWRAIYSAPPTAILLLCLMRRGLELWDLTKVI